MNILKKFSLWYKEHPIIGGIISVIITALPFILGIFLANIYIKKDMLQIIISLIFFIGFAVSYVLFTQFMNKQ